LSDTDGLTIDARQSFQVGTGPIGVDLVGRAAVGVPVLGLATDAVLRGIRRDPFVGRADPTGDRVTLAFGLIPDEGARVEVVAIERVTLGPGWFVSRHLHVDLVPAMSAARVRPRSASR
jgi:hypothetical protein